MKRIALLVVLVAVLLLIGVGALVARALESIEQEEAMRHGVVASRVFDEVERELTALIDREEERSFLEYTYLYVPEGQLPGTTGLSLSPLAQEPVEGYVLGHFQIDPDGALQLPWRPRPQEQLLLEANEWQVPDVGHRGDDEARLRELVDELQEPMRLEWGWRQDKQAEDQDPAGARDAAAYFEAPVELSTRPAPKVSKTEERSPTTADRVVAPEPAPPPAAEVLAAQQTVRQPSPTMSDESVVIAQVQEKEEAAPSTRQVEAGPAPQAMERSDDARLTRQAEAREEEEMAVASTKSSPRRKDRADKKQPSSEMGYLESLNQGSRSRAGRRSRSAPYSQGNTDVFRGDRGLDTATEEDDEAVLQEALPDEDADAEEQPRQEIWADEVDVVAAMEEQRGGGQVARAPLAGAELDTAGGQPMANQGLANGYGEVQGEVAFEPLAGRDESATTSTCGVLTEPAAEATGAEVDLRVSQRDAAADFIEVGVEEARQQVPEPTPEPTPQGGEGQNREAEQARLVVTEDASHAQAAAPPATQRRTSTTRRRPPKPQEPEESQEPELPVEVTVEPLIGLRLDADHLVLRRDVRLGPDHYVQGLVLRLPELAGHVHGEVVGGGDLEPFVTLTWDGLSDSASAAAGPFRFDHAFEAPFAQLGATLVLDRLPTDTGDDPRSWVLWLALLLAVVLLIGFGSLYRAVAVVVHFAERRNNFVAAVSHELKTPLTAIRMYGEILREGMVPSEERRQEYYETITTESERLSRLINNVLELSRLEKGTRSMALEAGNVAPIVEDVTRLLAAHAAEKGFELRAEVAADLPSVHFDRDALLQVLINLTDNAIKFAHGSDDKVVVLQCLREGDGVTLRVRDHGPGVPAGQLRRIFQPFFRGERELTRNTKGTGIGLALVQGLIEQMGGRVSARNHPQGGFEVSIALA